jgi:hypothetical protein
VGVERLERLEQAPMLPGARRWLERAEAARGLDEVGARPLDLVVLPVEPGDVDGPGGHAPILAAAAAARIRGRPHAGGGKAARGIPAFSDVARRAPGDDTHMQTFPSPAPRTAAPPADPVREWRRDQLLRAGCPWREAVLLSGIASVDLHEAEALFSRNCPVETALRILL